MSVKIFIYRHMYIFMYTRIFRSYPLLDLKLLSICHGRLGRMCLSQGINIRIYVYSYIYVNIYTFIYIHIYTYINIFIYSIYIHICIYIHMCIYPFIYIWRLGRMCLSQGINIRIYVYSYICKHIYIYIYTHIYIYKYIYI
jgi:hypothetical protein